MVQDTQEITVCMWVERFVNNVDSNTKFSSKKIHQFNSLNNNII